MKVQVLRDKNGKLLGRIKEFDNYFELRSFSGVLLGKYYPKQNVTRDKDGKLVGKGHLLAMVLDKE